jgi:hypothetical protein
MIATVFEGGQKQIWLLAHSKHTFKFRVQISKSFFAYIELMIEALIFLSP